MGIVTVNIGCFNKIISEEAMKRFLVLLMMLGALGTAAYSRSHFQAQAQAGIFYSSLSPYGEWVESDYGYGWRPLQVAHGWRPYLYGRWVWTDYGWYWVSSEPFGWATFHYGRWDYDDYYGWIWIPDNVWGPAWVEWRYDDDYIGWAPLSSYASFSLNIGISYRDRWVSPVHYWNFVPCRNFTSARIYENVQPVERAQRIFGSTRSAGTIMAENNRIVNHGVDVNFIERRANTHINRVDVVQRDRGRGERLVRESNRQTLEVYRPKIDAEPRRPFGTSTGRTHVGNPGEENRTSDRPKVNPNQPKESGHEQSRINIESRQTPRRAESVRPQEKEQGRKGYQQQERAQIQEQRQFQEQQRRQIPEQRLREKQAPRIERAQPPTEYRQQPQIRERSRQEVKPPAESRGGRDNRRRP